MRDALRFAFGKCGVKAVEIDEKSLQDVAAKKLRMSESELDIRLKELGATTKPWRKEQKLACLSAWMAPRSGVSPT